MRPPDLKNILIVRTDRIGDVVLTTPVFKALRKACPLARIFVLVTPATYALVQGNPYVDQVMVDDRQGCHKDLFGFLLLAREIRQGQFDAALILHTKRRYNLACYTAGIPWRIGYKNNKLGCLLTHPIKDVRAQGLKHEAEYCLDTLKVLGIDSAELDLFLPTEKSAEQWASEWMTQNNVNANEIIANHPGASDPTKCWPVANFAQLIDRLGERYQIKVVLMGGPESSPLSAEIMRLTSKPVLDLTGKTTVAQMVSLLRRTRLLISNDSGPVHIGAALNMNVISLFLRNQPGINPQRWKPLGPKSYVLVNKTGEEILLNKSGEKASGDMSSINPDQVLVLIEHIFCKDTQSIFYW